MTPKFVRPRLLSLFLCGLLVAAPTKVLLAAPSPAVTPEKVDDNSADQAKRNKEALAALATFKGDDLVKRLEDTPSAATKKEVELGEKAAKQISNDKTIKILDPKKDAAAKALYEKLNTMVERLARVSGRPEIKYKVTIIDSKTLNAFTLPNGNIYFYKGLLDSLYSDDEIAAVMAHEMAHNVCMHAMRGASKSRKFSLLNLAVLLAALSGGGKDAGAAVMFSQYLSVGLMNQYSMEYESEADIVGVADLIRAGYNPSAMVTVMRRFAADDERHPEINPGIFQGHPEPQDRADAIRKAIDGAGLEYNPREVNGVTGAEVVAEKENTIIQFRGTKIMEFPGLDKDTKTRATHAADSLNGLLKQNLHFYEITVMPDGANSLISARGIPIVTVTPDDAALQKSTVAETAAKWKQNLARLFWHETLEGGL